MKARIIRIGNSRGVRIPKSLLEQSHLTDEVRIEARENEIVISPVRLPRQGWDEAFRAMAERHDDRLLDKPRSTSFDEREWQW
jgi:antitoxin MazE